MMDMMIPMRLRALLEVTEADCPLGGQSLAPVEVMLDHLADYARLLRGLMVIDQDDPDWAEMLGFWEVGVRMIWAAATEAHDPAMRPVKAVAEGLLGMNDGH